MAMLKTALIFIAATGMSVPTAGMDMVNQLLRKIPDENSVASAFVADVDFWIGPDGKVRECNISRLVGNEERAKLICPTFVGYKMGAPKDSAGMASFGYTSTIVSAFPDGAFSLRNEMTAQLEQLPQASREQRFFEAGTREWRSAWLLVLEVGEDGRVRHCDRVSSKVDKELAMQACSSVADRSFTRRLDDKGNPVGYVRVLKAEAS